jgi:predicted DNA repair protein MutK
VAGGLLALFDDVVALAKVAAASLDDAAAQAAKAGSKAAGIVIDDAAVTPRYVVGFAADRELPIVMKIAVGSLKNKLLYLLPAALFLTVVAPWIMTPLLMAGGAFLCFEGYEKVHAMWHPSEKAEASPAMVIDPEAARAAEDERVAGAIRTDFILSAEIMAITLASITVPSIVTKTIVLAGVAVLVTALVYGAVALIVKADDFGVALAQEDKPVTRLSALLRGQVRQALPGDPSPRDRAVAPVTQRLGRALVAGMPTFLHYLALVGTLAMLWVGGGILLHGLAEYGLGAIEYGVKGFAQAIGAWIPLLGGLVAWAIEATVAGLVGLGLGWLVVQVMTFAGVAPKH